jgi:predicted ATP-dependent endonuclease of OLD family
MYLKKIHLKNIKCFEDVTLEFPHRGDDYSGWIVLLGENGTGKSTLLQAIAATIIKTSLYPTRLFPSGWVRTDAANGVVSVEIIAGSQDPHSEYFEQRLHMGHGLRSNDNPKQHLRLRPRFERSAAPAPILGMLSGAKDDATIGWFSCGYGPFRRISGWRRFRSRKSAL